MACNYCRANLYIKTIQYQTRILAPLTKADALRQQLEELTGERYLLLNNNYCPMCGSRIREENLKPDFTNHDGSHDYD